METPPKLNGNGAVVKPAWQVKPAKKKKERDLSGIALSRAILGIMQDQLLYADYPRFPYKILLAEDQRGVTIIGRVSDNKEVLEIPKKTFMSYLMAYTQSLIYKKGYDFDLSHRQISDLAEDQTLLLPRISIEDIPIIAEKSADGYAWTKLTYDLDQIGDYPYWEKLLGRCDQKKVIMMWIGSLFVPESPRDQWLWLYGDGNDGKSTILTALAKIFGNGYVSAEHKKAGSPFWKASFLGKRVAGFADCSNYDFVSSDAMKSLTGDPIHSIEFKKQTPFQACLATKFIIASNHKPEIKGGLAERRRALVCTFQPIIKMEHPTIVMTNLLKEAPAFLSECKRLYQKNNTLGQIPFDQSVIDELVDASEEKYHALFELCFELNPEERLFGSDMQDFYKNKEVGLSGSMEQKEFKLYLKRKGIQIRAVSQSGGKMAYEGLTFNAHFKKLKDAYKKGAQRSENTGQNIPPSTGVSR